MAPRRILPLLLVLAATGIGAAPVSAGTYVVSSCARALGNVNNAWVVSNGAATRLSTSTTCPPSGSLSGLLATDTPDISPLNTPTGSEAAWTASAPSGTTITRIRAWRHLGVSFDNQWVAFGATESGSFESCNFPPGTQCQVGSSGYSDAGVDDRNVTASSVSYGVRCGATTSCVNGIGTHYAWAALYGSELTLTDTSNPAVSNPSGPLWNGAVYHRGSEDVSFTAADNTGIKRTRVLVDSAPVSTSDRSCDYTFMKPCSDPAGPVTHSIDTSALADGPHTLKLAAYDATATNEGSQQLQVTTDNTAPAAPAGLVIAGGSVQSGQTFGASWQDAPGQVAPITKTQYTLCRQGGPAECPSSGETAQSELALPLPQGGSWQLSVWSEDAAGNVDPANAATVPVTFTHKPVAGGGPGPPVGGGAGARPAGLSLRRARLGRGWLRVSGRIVTDERVRLSFRAKVSGHRVRVARWAVPSLGRFRFDVRLRGRAARARGGTVRLRFAGNSAFAAAQVSQRVRAFSGRRR